MMRFGLLGPLVIVDGSGRQLDRPRDGQAMTLVFESPGYRLRLDDAELDSARFEALAEYDDRDWARGIAVRLEDQRLAVLEDRLAADLASGRHDVMVGELSALVDAHPCREGFVAPRRPARRSRCMSRASRRRPPRNQLIRRTL